MIKKEFFIWYHLKSTFTHLDVMEKYIEDLESSTWWKKQADEAHLQDINVLEHRDLAVMTRIAWDHTLTMKSLFRIQKALEEGNIEKAEKIIEKLIK